MLTPLLKVAGTGVLVGSLALSSNTDAPLTDCCEPLVPPAVVSVATPGDQPTVSPLSVSLVMAQVEAPRPEQTPPPVPEPEDIATAQPEPVTEASESSDVPQSACDRKFSRLAIGSDASVAPFGPTFCVYGNRKRTDGHYVAFVRYKQALADVDLELQSASRDLLLEMDSPLPEELSDETPVLLAQLVANDGEKDVALGLQADLGPGVLNGETIRFPLYHRVDGQMQGSAIAKTIESRLENPYTGLPRSFRAETVRMYLWVQFGSQRYQTTKPLTIELLRD